MKGLDVNVLRLSEARKENPSLRADSEYFSKASMRASALVAAKRNQPISEVVESVQHPAELTREYAETGLLVILAQNVRDNRIEFGNFAYMPESRRSLLEVNRLDAGDVLMTRSGANYGQSAPWKYGGMEAFACADLLVFRKPKIPSGYLSTFLSSGLGRALIDRGEYGMAQPHIAPSYLLRLRVPRFAKLETTIDGLVDSSIAAQRDAEARLRSVEELLTSTLGLGDWQPPEPLTYTRRAAEAFAARRLDSQYFAPRVAELIARLSTGGRTLRDVAPARHENFTPSKHGEFRYIEISDVHADGTARCATIAMRDAPSRATQFVRAGDVLTSTVRPNRRLSAIVSTEQDGCVASSGFVVLQPRAIPAEVLLTYLRLPPFCELMDLQTSASLYPAISERDLLALPFPKISQPTCDKIVSAVRDAHTARARARELLERAKRAVEIAIEQDEQAALRLLG